MPQEPFGDIPLFREIQRLLATGGGPINYEIARQVALAIATEGTTEATPEPQETRELMDAVHRSETIVSGYTRLPLEEPLQAQVVSRTWWTRETLDAWRWLLEHLAMRFSGEMGRMGPEGEEGETNPMQAVMGQIAPLLMGIQIGSLVGHLAREQFGRYDLPIPRDDDGKLFVVAPNAAKVAGDYALPPGDVVRWIALQEVARGLITKNVTWVNPYLRSALHELVDSIELDTAALERRLMELQGQTLESLQEGLGLEGGLPIVPSERHTRALRRMQAMVALFEGYANEACRQVGSEVIQEQDRVDEAMARRAASPSEGESMLASLLGLSFDRALEQSGQTFCAAVVSLRGLPALNRVWEAPDNLPTFDEIKDPFAWMERVLAE